MKKSEALRLAKARLWDGLSIRETVKRRLDTHICSALMDRCETGWREEGPHFDQAGKHTPPPWHYHDPAAAAAAKAVREVIRVRLAPCMDLEEWLAKALGIKHWDFHPSIKDLQRHRHQWVDMLIAEFESQGD